MKRSKTNLLIILALAVNLAMPAVPALAQRVKTNSKILYHGGPVLRGTSNIYLIWYGVWDGSFLGSNAETQSILIDFFTGLGASPYFRINTLYPDATGGAPSGSLIYGGSVNDAYSHGPDLNALAIQGIVNRALDAGSLPLDSAGIYVVMASSDVSSNSTGFCTPNAPPHHGSGNWTGSPFRYVFVGNPERCPTIAAPQFFADGSRLPTPNDNFAADAMASTIAHALDATVTNPTGTAWFDRYGFENADKCQGTFGQTYLTGNGARANIRLGPRDFLIQQNWVNVSRGYCALSYP